MGSLKAFMLPPVTDETKDIVIGKRFVTEKGEPQPFTIRVISQEVNENLRKQCARPIKRNGTIIGEDFDSIKFGKLLVIACTAYPDFRSTELCEFYKTMDPLDVPSKMLTAGEYAKLVSAINELNGFTGNSEDLEEEAKNS